MEAGEDDVPVVDVVSTGEEYVTVSGGDDVIAIGEDHGTVSGGNEESEQCGAEDAGPELGTEEEEDADADEFEVEQDEGDEGVDNDKDKEDENMVVVDELDIDDQKSTSDEESMKPVLDPEMSEFHLLRMPPINTITSDLQRLRVNRCVSVYPLTLDELNHTDIKNILDSSRCEEVKLQMVRPSNDPKTWAGFLTVTFATSKAASSAIEALKSFKEGLTAKLDPTPYQTCQSFVKSERTSTSTSLLADWTKRLLLVRCLSSKTKPEDLQSIFPGAEEIVVSQDVTIPHKLLKRAAKQGNDGYACVLYGDEETAKSVAEELTATPPVFLEFALDVKLYREPKEVPSGLLRLRTRKVILKHHYNLTRKMAMSPMLKVPADADKRVARCDEVIAKDDAMRRQVGLPTPTLQDFQQIRGLKPMKTSTFTGILSHHGILEHSTPTNPEKGNASRGKRGQGQPSARARGGSGRGQPFARGRGQSAPRGGRGTPAARGRGQLSARGRGGFSRGFGGGRSYPPSGGYSSQSLGDLQANALGVVNEIKRLIQQQQPMLGYGEGRMSLPAMDQGGMGMQRGRGTMGGAGPLKRPFSRGMGGGPPPKGMRMDDSDRGMHMYERDDQFRYDRDDRQMLPPGHNTEYRPPPTRNQPRGRGGPLGPGSGLGGPRGYENVGHGGSGSDYDINLLMNISKVLQNADQSRHRMY